METTIKKFQIILFVLLFAGFVFISHNSMAQNHIILGYDYSIPLGNTEEYIDANSFRGGSFEFGHHLTERMAIGLKVGLHTFYQELEKDTYTDDNVTIYGKQFRYINSFSSLATFQYNIVDMENDLIPFVKLGVGGYYFQKRTDMGLYTFTNIYNWSFGLQPEIGVLTPLTENIGFSINGRYNYLFKNQELDAQNYFTVSIGLVFMNLGQQGINE